MPRWPRILGRGLVFACLFVLLFLDFRAHTDVNPYDREVSILLLTETIGERDAFLDLILAHKDFKHIDVHAMEEQKNLRFTKYELVVIPSSHKGLKESLTKYYETGTGVFVYGEASAKDLNSLFGLASDSEDFLILGTGEGSMAKLGQLRLAKNIGDVDYSFDVVGRYGEPGNYIRVDLGQREDYNYKLLRAIVDVHNDAKLRSFGTKSPSRLSFYSYLGDGSTVIREFLSLYRDYSYDVQGYFRFKLISELELRTREGLLDEVLYRVNTNEYASVLDINPKRAPGLKSLVDKGREEATYHFCSPSLLPHSLSSKVLHSSQSFQITTEELRLTTEVNPRIYYGIFNQYELYPAEDAGRKYNIEVLF